MIKYEAEKVLDSWCVLENKNIICFCNNKIIARRIEQALNYVEKHVKELG